MVKKAAPGLGVDAAGGPAIDPTKNVLDRIDIEMRRQDDLREMADRHTQYIIELRALHYEELRDLEAKRIDAIRAVDVGAVNRAAEVAATQANVLAAQLQATAEASRVNLIQALEPIQKDIQDLRKAQYEIAGAKTQTGETRLNLVALVGVAGFIVGIVIALIPYLLR